MNQHHATRAFSAALSQPSSAYFAIRTSITVSILCTQRNNGHMSVIEGVSTEFITGNDPSIECTSLLGGGGFGKVYCVGKIHGS